MKSGGLKISISLRMYNLSMYLICILILANMFNSCCKVGYKLHVG